ncbi:MAG: hypothetical protein AAF578_00300 [Pseudomonadota bacterium]
MNLLAQSGYSTIPDSPLGAVGRAQIGAQQQMQNQRLTDAETRFIESQIGVNNARAESLGMPAAAPAEPSAVREYQFFNRLTPAQKEQYLRVKRAQTIINTPGGGLQTPDATTGDLRTLTPEEQIVSGMQGRAAAQEAGRQGAVTQAIPDQVAARGEAERREKAIDELGPAIQRNDAFRTQAQTFIEVLQNGELETGFWRGKLPAYTTEEQLFEAFSGQQVLDQLSSVTLGAISRDELDLLKSTVSNRENTREANIRLLQQKLQILEDVERRLRERAGMPTQESSAPDFSQMSDAQLQRYIQENGG